MPGKTCNHSAFTLVELAMTALLLSIGLLTVFALLQRGIASRTELEEEVRASLFADSVFNTLRAHSDELATAADTNLWENFWYEFETENTNLVLAASENDMEGRDDETLLWGSEGIQEFAYDPDSRDRIYYRITTLTTNAVFSQSPDDRAQVTLHVWPSRSTNRDPHVFFTTFSNPGRLP